MPGPRTIDVPRLLHIGAGAARDLDASLLDGFDLRHVLIVTGRDISRVIGSGLENQLESVGCRVDRCIDPDGSIRSAAELLERLDENPITLILAVGGGRPIDVAKLAAARASIDVVAMPTVLSHDGMCSPVASLVGRDGVRRSLGAAMPAGVVVDTEIVGRAPERYLRAGISDLVSNLTAIEDWRRSSQATGEPVDELAASIAAMSATAVLDIDWPPTLDQLESVARGLVMSGLAMEVAGSSRPCSGAEHLISHALDQLRPGGKRMHGEQVALGVLLLASVHDHAPTDHVVALLHRVGFPACLGALGLDREVVASAIRRASATRPDRYTILDELELTDDTIDGLIADSIGTWLR